MWRHQPTLRKRSRVTIAPSGPWQSKRWRYTWPRSTWTRVRMDNVNGSGNDRIDRKMATVRLSKRRIMTTVKGACLMRPERAEIPILSAGNIFSFFPLKLTYRRDLNSTCIWVANLSSIQVKFMFLVCSSMWSCGSLRLFAQMKWLRPLTRYLDT